MKAIVQDRYGPPESLALRDIDPPGIANDELLIRVHAAALHIGDCFAVRGSPLPMRMATGLFRPARRTPGFDVAGSVERIGSNVSGFKPGDDVFGTCYGGCAEFTAAKANTVALKPTKLTFQEAAAIPTSGQAALHGLRDAGRLESGQRVLINGAAGGIGTFAVQIAKAFGAEVTGVCSTRNVDLIRSLGADRVIDYSQEDFADGATSYDLIFDNVENRPLSVCRRALKPAGTLVLNSGTGARGIAMLLRLAHPLALSPFVPQNLRRFLSRPNQPDLLLLKGLVEHGHLRPVLGRTYALSEVPDALRYVEGGHTGGKVVIAIC